MNYGKRDKWTYYDWSRNANKDKAIIGVDQEKFNLTWLVFPEIEEHGLEFIPDEYAESLKNMDGQTRAALSLLPLSFLRYWKEIDDGALAIAQAMPGDYLYRMEAQAAEAQKRLLVIEEAGNVVKINFRGQG